MLSAIFAAAILGQVGFQPPTPDPNSYTSYSYTSQPNGYTSFSYYSYPQQQPVQQPVTSQPPPTYGQAYNPYGYNPYGYAQPTGYVSYSLQPAPAFYGGFVGNPYGTTYAQYGQVQVFAPRRGGFFRGR